MTAEVYRTADGDMVDEIAWRYYSKRQQPLAVERVYDANPGLADFGPILPAGVLITLPELPVPDAVPVIRLWD